ncbi:Uncharacterised protein [uncultured Clostridium sp.]|nr:Uncharacterised protein [uncultured Clostridium sp.]
MENTFKIELNIATINSAIIPENSEMTNSKLEAMAHFYALTSMKEELISKKAYQALLKAENNNPGISREDILTSAAENPSHYGFTDLKQVAEAVETSGKIYEISADLVSLSSAKEDFHSLTEDGDRLVVQAYAWTAYNKLSIPAFGLDKSGVKALSDMVINYYQTNETNESELITLVGKKLQALFNYAFTKKTAVFKAVKIREKDIPREVTKNFLARCSKRARVNKDSGELEYSYTKNKKGIEQGLTEAFAMCLISRLDSFELSEPGTQNPVTSPENSNQSATPVNPVKTDEKSAEPEKSTAKSRKKSSNKASNEAV